MARTERIKNKHTRSCGEKLVIDPEVLQWVLDAREGDEDAITNLVEMYQDAVYNLCYRILGERMEAEDAAQEAFLRAFANLDRYDTERPFKTWLLTIASNHAIDRIRKRRLAALSIDDDEHGEWQIASDMPEPEQAVLQHERSALIQAMLNELSPEYRAAVTLRYWYDYSYSEIAEMLETTESAVKSRLFRARQQLAEKLTAEQVARLMGSLMES
jgi:RNA polymerase sigma-70 factor, ECF subfamily